MIIERVIETMLLVVSFIASQMLIDGGIEPNTWYYWGVCACIIATFTIGYLKGMKRRGDS